MLLAVGLPGQAQTYQVLVNCDTANASSTAPLTPGPDGNLYGTTTQGRTYGTVFKMTPSGSLTTLHTFDSTDGASPTGGVMFASDGNLYGTTNQGGSATTGSVFKVSTGGSFTSLYSFTGTSEDGGAPVGKLVQAGDGNLYGVTYSAGANGCGAIYQMTTSGTFTSLYNFNCQSDGGYPRSGLILASDGNLYGTTSAAGVSGYGTVYRIGLDGSFAVIYHFGNNEGNTPYAALIQGSDGAFYGTTYQGGSGGYGTAFRLTTAGSLTTLYSFSGTDGKNPRGSLLQGSDGNLYGTTYYGGNAIYGTIFVVTPDGQFTRLHSFTGGDGQNPAAGLAEDPAGTFIGTTFAGGTNNKGVVFSLTYTAPPPPAPAINANGVVPVYSTVPVIQTGEWVSIYGSNLAAKSATWNGDFPTSLGGTTVTIGGESAYLWYVNPGQINLQVPGDLPTGSASVVVNTGTGTATSTVTVARQAPSFSLLDSKHVAGIILRSDGSGAYGSGAYDILGPTGETLGYPTVAATAGDSVELFGVGFGPTNPAVPAGQPFSGAAGTVAPVAVSINGVSIAPSFAGMSSAGIYQLNITIPSGLHTGDVSLQASVSGSQTPLGTVISLQ